MKNVWSPGLETSPSEIDSIIWNPQSAFRWKIFQRLKREKTFVDLLQLLQKKVLRFTPAVAWKTFDVFYRCFRFRSFSIQWFDVHLRVESSGPAVRATPRLFDPFETTDLRLYSHLDGPPINKNEFTCELIWAWQEFWPLWRGCSHIMPAKEVVVVVVVGGGETSLP